MSIIIKNSTFLRSVAVYMAIITWLFFTILTVKLTHERWDESLANFFHAEEILVKNLFLSFFFVSVYGFFHFNEKSRRNITQKFFETQVTTISASCLIAHLIMLWLEHFTTTPLDTVIWLNIINNVNILVGTIFCANCFFYFKRLILFQKTRVAYITWRAFETLIFLSILTTIFNVSIHETSVIISLSLFALLTLFLSTQMRWVAFLTKRNKLRMVFSFSFYLLILTLILQNFFFESSNFGEDAQNKILVVDCIHKFFLLVTSTFVILYCLSSVLILFFHLPTASVFDDNITINKNFKKLSNNLFQLKTHEDVYQLLLDTALSTCSSTYGWIMLSNSKSLIKQHDIKEQYFESIQNFIQQNKAKKIGKQFVLENIDQMEDYSNQTFLKEQKIRSILITPIVINNIEIAQIGILKTVSDAFDTDTLDVIQSYAYQTGTSIENIDLFNQTLENERYHEEMKIARNVKKRLLKNSLNISPLFDISFFNSGTDIVGGDFFDIQQINDTNFIFIIADVSGNGTGAAFNLAQLRGSYKTIIQNIDDFDLYPGIFNNVMLDCLEESSFVSLSLFKINTTIKEITHYRCGHIPTIWLNEKESEILKPNGLGLGMIENEQFEKIIEKKIFNYSTEDHLIAFTDGLIENTDANINPTDGVLSVLKSIKSLREKTSTEILENIKEDFLNKNLEATKNDTTCVCIKFK